MKRSIELSAGIYQWEWLDDRIAVARWDAPPTSTLQWFVTTCERFYLEGSCNEDIRVVDLTNEKTRSPISLKDGISYKNL